MKKISQLFIFGFAIILSSCSNNSTDKSVEKNKTPETEIEKLSYSIGVMEAQSLKSKLTQFELDTISDANAIAKAFIDVLEGNDLDISAEESMKIINEYLQKVQEAALSPEERAKMEADTKLASEKRELSKIEGSKYLAENGAKEGVTTTESGLQYEVMNSGNGEKPTAEDQVTVHYHGMLTNGTVFDSSVDRGEPAQFGVTQVIAGWTEALQLMSIGDKWKLTIPPSLAYGDKGAGGLIGPGETLVFEVELLSIK